VIIFDHVTKRYPGGTVAVDGLDLEVPDGKIVVLVGPSGCGKTTSLRMINRLVEPTDGRILLDGTDVATVNPSQLRRGIGYVIQQTGLFPHRTIEDNIATVPVLNGWGRSKGRARARELMNLVGLDPQMARRYPHQLSGGQQQRVGVARALAADPPVLLMDEPFSAVDPIVRASLQDELVRLQAELHKTVVLVTHDVEEAIKVGDLVAVFRPGGHLAQVDTPERLLGEPADPYVEDFVGFDRGIRRLSFFDTEALDLGFDAVLEEDTTAAAARRAAAAADEPWILVLSEERFPRGWVASADLASLGDTVPLSAAPMSAVGHTFLVGADSLRAALDATILSPAGRAVGVDADGKVVGVTSFDRLRAAIQRADGAARDRAAGASPDGNGLPGADGSGGAGRPGGAGWPGGAGRPGGAGGAAGGKPPGRGGQAAGDGDLRARAAGPAGRESPGGPDDGQRAGDETAGVPSS
jgi:osmoprotectant transport system ATP-binding protein